VRLEADAAGGVLHVRATVVGDDGRAQSFRRLALHVAGPEGFARELPSRRIGAGAYAATSSLAAGSTSPSRRRARRQAVGTTGAVLTAGEEASAHRLGPPRSSAHRRFHRGKAARHPRRRLRRPLRAPASRTRTSYDIHTLARRALHDGPPVASRPRACGLVPDPSALSRPGQRLLAPRPSPRSEAHDATAAGPRGDRRGHQITSK